MLKQAQVLAPAAQRQARLLKQQQAEVQAPGKQARVSKQQMQLEAAVLVQAAAILPWGEPLRTCRPSTLRNSIPIQPIYKQVAWACRHVGSGTSAAPTSLSLNCAYAHLLRPAWS